MMVTLWQKVICHFKKMQSTKMYEGNNDDVSTFVPVVCPISVLTPALYSTWLK